MPHPTPIRLNRTAVSLWAMLTALTAGLVVYARKWSWNSDEGFHLVAAQLIAAGKKPYIDFFYQHVPLYVYLNAGWMRLFGLSVNVSHTLSGLLTGAAVAMAASYVFSSLREARWRLAGGMTAALLISCNMLVILTGTVAEAYGLCLFLTVSAFRLTVESVNRRGLLAAAGAGFCAAASAGAHLLTTPVAPVLLGWIWRRSRAGGRKQRCLSFLVGSAIPLLPIAWLFTHAPRRFFFDVLEYHLSYRGHAFTDDVRVLTSWLDSPQAVLLALLAGVALLALSRRDQWDEAQRAECHLCAALVAGLLVPAALAHPTFELYFAFAVPFLAILASLGTYVIGSWPLSGRLGRSAVLIFTGLFATPVARLAHYHWGNTPRLSEFEHVAREVDRVTPVGGEIWAGPIVYFLAKRLPPPGFENYYSRDLPLAAARAASLGIVLRPQQHQWLASGRFATVVTDPEDPEIATPHVLSLYAKRKRIGRFEIFWDRISLPAGTPVSRLP